MMRTRMFAAGAASAAVLAGGGLTPAVAADPCDAGHACFYQNVAYDGTHFETEIASSNWDWAGNIYAMRFLNDRDSSVDNNWRTYPVTWYKHDSYSGYIHCLSPGVAMRSYPAEDNQGSSHKAAGTRC